MFIILTGILACILFYFAYDCICNQWEKFIGVLCIIADVVVIALGAKAQYNMYQLREDIATEKQTRKQQVQKLHKLVAANKVKIFIDGKSADDDFDLDGIRLKDYDIKFNDGKVYLISRHH